MTSPISREARAVAEHACPRCLSPVGAACLNPHDEPMPYVHRARLALDAAAHKPGRRATGATTRAVSVRVPREHADRVRAALPGLVEGLLSAPKSAPDKDFREIVALPEKKC